MNHIRRIATSLPLPTLVLSSLVLSSLVLSWLLIPVAAQAQAAGQKTFASSKEAVAAFVQAVRDGNDTELQAILGPDSEQIINSGDPVADKASGDWFVKAYDTKHALVASGEHQMTLQVGNDGWPLAIPLVRAGEKWSWDGAAGKEELLYRRIGKNELAAIEVCKSIVSAQHDYASTGHDGQPAGAYASRLVSDAGKQNGLYWEVSEGENPSPAGPMLAQAATEGYDTPGKRVPYHGYYYRMLPAKAGFGFVAYPAQYRSSGVMTFIVNQKGLVYQKDLGEKTSDLAEQISSYSPDKTWSPVK